MYPHSDRRAVNRQFQEVATQRKAANDTQFFWDLVNRNIAHPVSRKNNRSYEERTLFHKKDGHDVKGVLDDSIPVQRSGPDVDNIPVLTSFEDLRNQVPSSVLRCVELLRFTSPTPIQKHAIPLGLGGQDLMCCAQTVGMLYFLVLNSFFFFFFVH